MSSKGIVAAVVVVIVLVVGYGATQVSPFKQDFADFVGSASNSQTPSNHSATTSINSSQNEGLITPVSPDDLLNSLSNNNAAAPSPLIGQSTYVLAIIDNVKGNALTGFYSDETDLYSTTLGTESAIFHWANQSVASNVPTNGTLLVTRCTVGGTQGVNEDPLTGANLGTDVVLNGCTVVVTEPQYCTNLLSGVTVNVGWIPASTIPYDQAGVNDNIAGTNFTGVIYSPTHVVFASTILVQDIEQNVSEQAAPSRPASFQVTVRGYLPLGLGNQPQPTVPLAISFVPTSGIDMGSCSVNTIATYGTIQFTSPAISTTSSSSTVSSTVPVQSSQLMLGGILHSQYFSSSYTGTSFACGTNGASLGPDWGALSIMNNGPGAGAVTGLTLVYQGQSTKFSLIGSCNINPEDTTSLDFSTQSHLSTTPVAGQTVQVVVTLSTGAQLQLNSTFY